MGKKRKAGGQPFGEVRKNESEQEDAKLKFRTWEDVADSEDEFHINRDKILLDEGPAQKRRRKLEEEGMQRISAVEATQGQVTDIDQREVTRIFR